MPVTTCDAMREGSAPAPAARPEVPPVPAGCLGAVAEFADPETFRIACGRVREEGYRDFDAYSPFPVHGLDRAMGIRRTRLPLFVFGGGLSGAALGFLFGIPATGPFKPEYYRY